MALARALITEPAILLADEPTGNLDRVTGAAIMSLLQRSYNELKQTVIVVTHDPFAATYAKRVIFLKDGCLISELYLTQDMEQAQKVAVIIDKIRGSSRFSCMQLTRLLTFRSFRTRPLRGLAQRFWCSARCCSNSGDWNY